MIKVMLISGHNFKEQGCHNAKLGVSEYKCVQKIIDYVMSNEELTNVDTVYKARNANLKTLPAEVNSWDPDFTISVHLNALNGKVQRSETLHYATSAISKKWAEKFTDIASKHTGFRNGGAVSRSKDERGWWILAKTKSPCILIEPFFLDAIETQEELDKQLENAGKAVLEFLEYLGNNFSVK